MDTRRFVLLLLLLLATVVLQGCGTETYDDRAKQRADELRYSVDQYED